jgi:hypothetical protein
MRSLFLISWFGFAKTFTNNNDEDDNAESKEDIKFQNKCFCHWFENSENAKKWDIISTLMYMRHNSQKEQLEHGL